jgi:hypothetical protein
MPNLSQKNIMIIILSFFMMVIVIFALSFYLSYLNKKEILEIERGKLALDDKLADIEERKVNIEDKKADIQRENNRMNVDKTSRVDKLTNCIQTVMVESRLNNGRGNAITPKEAKDICKDLQK